jgi:hypothetical protein
VRGRIRTVKPELFKSEALWDLQVETGLPVTQGFVGLWCYADREGRFEWKPRALKSDILPYWDGDMADLLEALASRSFISRYTVDGKDYGHIRSWKEHQRPDHREPASVLPPPEAHGVTGNPLGMPGGTPGPTEARPGGREGKGREGEGNGTDLRARAEMSVSHVVIKKIPEDWIPSAELLAQVELGGCPRAVFDSRLAELRLGPIGGQRGVFPDQLDRYILTRAMDWKNWAAAAPTNAPRGSPAPRPYAITGRDDRGYPLTLEASQRHRAYAAKHCVDLAQVMASIEADGIINKLGLERAREVIGERLAKLAREKAKQCQAPNQSATPAT